MGKIFLASDWHLIRRDKETGLIYVRPDASKILYSQQDVVTNNDTFIFMGDMFDDDVVNTTREYEKILGIHLVHMLTHLKGKHKIFIRGNNDIWRDDFYKETFGFDEVKFAHYIPEQEFVISHTSLPITLTHPDVTNIHGHIHRDNCDCDTIPYYHNPMNCINICNRDRKTFSINTVKPEECTRNTSYTVGGCEKPFSRYIQEMALSEFIKQYNEHNGV